MVLNPFFFLLSRSGSNMGVSKTRGRFKNSRDPRDPRDSEAPGDAQT